MLYSAWSVYQLQPWTAGSATSSRSHSSIEWSNVSPFGVNTFLSGEVESWKRERTMEMVADAGISWIRQGFAWSEIEPENNVYWDAKYQQDAWAKFDEIVTLAEEYGIRIIARLDHTPAWARPGLSDPATPPSNPDDFGDFVFEFVSRYHGRIDFIQIWNEPNLAREWGGEINAQGYAALLGTAAERAREANPNVVILSAPMAMTTENSGRAQDELSYWQALYDFGISDSFDIISANAYGLAAHYLEEPNESVLNLRRVELLRELAIRNGDSHKAIWFNEFGWNAAPADFPEEELTWSRVDEHHQAEWTADAITFAQQQWDWFGVANIWYFRQVGNVGPERADYYFRMVDLEFTPRGVYRTVQELSSESSIAGMGYIGELEQAVTPYGSWSIVKNASSSDGRHIVGHAGETISMHFEGSALDVHIVESESNGSFTVTLYDGTSSASGGSNTAEFNVRSGNSTVRITEGNGEHPSPNAPQVRTAVIRVNENAQLAIDGFSVDYQRSYRNLITGSAMTIVSLLGILGLRRPLAR